MKQAIVVAAVLAYASVSVATQKKAITLPGANPNLPFSSAVWTGDFLHTSGALGGVPGQGYSPDIKEQTRQTFENLTRVLEAAGSDLSRVVSVSVYLTDDRHYEAMNEVFRETFPDQSKAPVRATVRTDLAAPAGYIEVSMIAVREGVDLRHITPDGWQPARQGFAYGILAGDTLFVSGMVSSDPEQGTFVNGDIGAQAKRTLDNIGEVLKAAGMSYADVVSNRVYLRDGRDFSGWNETYRSVFPEPRPARATVRAGIMHPDARVEVQSVAVKDSARKVAGNAQPNATISPSVVAGGRQFLAGMTGRTADGYAPGDVKAQTRQCIARLKATLEAAGLTMDDVVESTVFLTDIRHFADMNEVYRELVPSPRPSRTTVGTALMSPGRARRDPVHRRRVQIDRSWSHVFTTASARAPSR